MHHNEQGFSLKSLFLPLTTKKAVIILVIIGILVYCNALFGAFVWDDAQQMQPLSSFSKFFLGNSFGDVLKPIYYRPLLYLLFSLIYSLFGTRTFFFHVIQVSIHILNAIILYLILNNIFHKIGITINEKLSEKDWNRLSGSQKVKYLRAHRAAPQAHNIPEQKTSILSLFLTLIFVVHPINAQAVSYISALNDPLYFLFGSLALLLSLKEHISIKRVSVVGLLLLCSLFSKETGFLFLLLILCFKFLFNRDRISAIFIVEVAALSIYSFARFAIGGVFFKTFSSVPIAKLPFLERLANVPAIIFYYLRTMFFPMSLTIDQIWIVAKLTAQDFYLPLLLDSVFFIALFLGGVFIYTRKREYFTEYFFFFLWFLIGLLFHMQIFPLDMTVSDTWFYFPLVGVLGMLGVCIQAILISPNKQDNHTVKYRKVITAAALCGAILLILLSIRTMVRNTNFHDEITLYAHDTQLQYNPSLETDLGTDYIKTGNTHEYLAHLDNSVRNFPYPENLFHLGNYYESVGSTQKAEEYYYKAFNVAETSYAIGDTHDPQDQNIYIRLAGLLLLSNEYDKARQISIKGLQYFPKSSFLWEELAVSENKLQDQRGALDAIEKANTIAPSEFTNLLHTIIANRSDIPAIMITMLLHEQEPIKGNMGVFEQNP